MALMQGHYRKGFSQKNEVYEDEYDDYEDDGIEDDVDDDDDEEKVEESKLNKEELEFLKVREKLKEKFRQELKKQSAQSFDQSSQSQDKKRTSAKDNFGSFFGPSQPVIASRVLDESRSIRETRHVTSKTPSSSSGREGVSSVSSSERKVYEHHQRPKVNEVKMKAQALKDMRDYSFLFSDDADLPDKESPPASRHASAPKPLAGSAQTPLESKVPISRPLKSAYNGRESKNVVPASRVMQTKMPTKEVQVSRHIPSSSESRKPLPKPMPSKVPLQSKVVGQVMGTKKLNGKPENIPSTLRPHNSTQNHYVEQKRASQATDRSKPAPKQAPLMKSQPPKTIPSRDISDERLKKRPVKRRQDEDNGGDAIQMIRKMFGYNPSRYSGMDDDDSDMEAGFNQIQMEEQRSAQIARKEDEEQLLLIEEEERRERMRKKQKANRR